MAEGPNGPVEEVEPTTAPEEKILTPQLALHSIAVELARGNRLTAQSLQLQATQIQLVQNVLDILRAQMGNAKDQIDEHQGKAIAMVEKFLEPLLALTTLQAKAPPAQLAPEPADPPPVVTEGGGTRIAAVPEEPSCP